MPTLAEARDQVRDLASKSLAIYNDESLTGAEKRARMDALEPDLKKWEQEVSDLSHVDEQRKRIAKALGADGGGNAGIGGDKVARDGVVKSMGEQFVESAGYKQILEHKGVRGTRISTGGVETFRARDQIGQKATFTEAAGAAGLIVPTYQTSVVEILFRRLVVADLYPGGAVTSPTLIYPKESSVTNAAAPTSEGGTYPSSDLNVVQVTEHLSKISTMLKVSDETLEDVPATQAYINGRLQLFVQLAEETDVLSGNGTAPNMTGLLNRSGLQTAISASKTGASGAPLPIDAAYQMMTQIRYNAFVEPDAMVWNPVDWEAVRLTKDQNGQYYGGGPFTAAYGNNGAVMAPDMLWGCRVVVTPAMAQGTFLVGSFQMCAQLFRKGGITIEATNSDTDDFENGLIAIRAQERLLQAVYRPGGFGTVTIGA